MKRYAALFILFLLVVPADRAAADVVGNSDQKPKYTYRLIVKFKKSFTSTLESAMDARNLVVTPRTTQPTLQAFLRRHHLNTLEPVHKDLVLRKIRTGKSVAQLAADIQTQYPERAKRFRGRFAPPDLSLQYVVTPSTPTDAAVAAALASLRQDPGVESIQRERIAQAQMVPNDPYYSSSGTWGQPNDDLWGLKKIQAGGAWDLSTGAGIVVAVVDTGVDYNHPDIAANMLSGHDFVGHSWWAPVEGADPMDYFGHGTHCAGTIAALGNNSIGVIGVAFGAKILPVKALDDNGSGPDSSLGAAIRWAADHGAQVISMSFGGSGDAAAFPVEAAAIDYAYQMGAVLVAAAGNSSVDAGTFYPASSPEVITVAASDPNDQACFFSNYGQKIDVTAPGCSNDQSTTGPYQPYRNILSLRSAQILPSSPLANPGLAVGSFYLREAGTSQAAPYVSGVTALILAAHPLYTNEEVRSVLRNSADDVGTAGFDFQSGYGRINALKTLSVTSAPMTAHVVSPGPQTTIASPISVTGTAGGPTFATYKLEFGVGASPSSWTLLTSQTVPVVRGVLGTFDPRLFPNGAGVLRLTVTNASNATTVDSVLITAQGISITNPAAPAFPNAAPLLKPGASVSISGQAVGLAFQNFILEWGEGLSPAAWSATGITLAGGGTTPVAGGLLGAWNTSAITKGAYYTIRLTVRTAGYATQTQSLIYLEPDLTQGWPQVLNTVGTTPSLVPMRDAALQPIFGVNTLDHYYRFSKSGSLLASYSQPSLSWGRAAAGALSGGPGDDFISANGAVLNVFRANGSMFNLTPVPYPQYFNLYGTPLVATDLDRDGYTEVLALGASASVSNQDLLYAFRKDGTPVSARFPIAVNDQDGSLTLWQSPRMIASDFDGDGKKEIFVLNGNALTSSTLKMYTWDGAYISGRDINFPHHIVYDMAVADLDRNGQKDLIVATLDPSAYVYRVYVFLPDGSAKAGFPVSFPQYWLNTHLYIAVGDLDRDGHEEIVLAGGAFINVLRSNGHTMAGWPIINTVPYHQQNGAPALGDLDGDGYPEIVTTAQSIGLPNPYAGAAAGNPSLYFENTMTAYRRDGTILKTWTIMGTSGEGPNADMIPTIGDFMGDGKVRIALSYSTVNQGVHDKGVVALYDLYKTYTQANVPWPSLYHDPQNSAVLADGLTPSVPGTSVFTGVYYSSFTVRWTASNDYVAATAYHIDMSTNATFSPYWTGYKDKNLGKVLTVTPKSLLFNTTYYIHLRAYDAAGNYSPDVNLSTTTLADTAAPAAPTGVTPTAVYYSSFTLRWTASTDNIAVTAYHIDMSTNATFSPYWTGYKDKNLGKVLTVTPKNLLFNTTYYIRLRAYDAAGNYSPDLSVSTATMKDATPPTAPAGVAFSRVYKSSFTLVWSASTDNIGVTGYYVDLSSTNFASYWPKYQNRSLGNVLTLTVSGLLSKTAYSVRLRAADASGNVSIDSVPGVATTASVMTVGVPEERVAPSPLDAIRVYPNPWRSDRDTGRNITFDRLPAGAEVKIFTVSARWVATVTADANGKAVWDRRNEAGDGAASGFYIYLASDHTGAHARGKFAIIK